ncbi:MAG: hypothetical protein U0269_36295 [Polyangiales bacterium]
MGALTVNDITKLLDSLRDEYSARDERESREKSLTEQREREQRAAAEQHERAAREATQRAERERERAELLTRARHYLATLVPDSREGRWFSDFAKHYSTREDAAIEVVRAQDELERVL